MDGINGARPHYATNLKATASSLEPTDKVGASPTSEVQPGALSGNTTTRLSPMAQLLSDAAARAAERDASNDRAGLAYIARRATQDFYVPYSAKNKEIRDAEVPPSDDPQRLDQAQQATNFLNKKGVNPFQNLSNEQLTLVIYDDSGDFTHNERRVAWEAYTDSHAAWALTVTNKLMDEYHRNGKASSLAGHGMGSRRCSVLADTDLGAYLSVRPASLSCPVPATTMTLFPVAMLALKQE
jgi:hypothetical protein